MSSDTLRGDCRTVVHDDFAGFPNDTPPQKYQLTRDLEKRALKATYPRVLDEAAFSAVATLHPMPMPILSEYKARSARLRAIDAKFVDHSKTYHQE